MSLWLCLAAIEAQPKRATCWRLGYETWVRVAGALSFPHFTPPPTGVQQDSIGVTLQETIAEHLRGVYDPSVTRHVFQTNSKVIAWMDFMVTRPAWRALLYELRDKHKTDAVLGLAMSTIERHGHQDELATFLLGFRLFNNALVQSVSKMVARDAGEEELARFRYSSSLFFPLFSCSFIFLLLAPCALSLPTLTCTRNWFC